MGEKFLRDIEQSDYNLNCSEDLLQAIKNRDVATAEALLVVGHNVETRELKKWQSLLHISCSLAWQEGIELLDKYGADFESVDVELMTPIFSAIASGNLQVIKYLIEEKKVNYEHTEEQGRSIFYWGSVIGDLALIEYLIERFPHMVHKASGLGRTALSKAAWNGRLDVAEKILELGTVEV